MFSKNAISKQKTVISPSYSSLSQPVQGLVGMYLMGNEKTPELPPNYQLLKFPTNPADIDVQYPKMDNQDQYRWSKAPYSTLNHILINYCGCKVSSNEPDLLCMIIINIACAPICLPATGCGFFADSIRNHRNFTSQAAQELYQDTFDAPVRQNMI